MADIDSKPRLRKHARKDRHGVVTIYYYWDGRGHHVPDIPLGKDAGAAFAKWEVCEKNFIAQSKRDDRKTRMSSRQTGKRRRIVGLLADAPVWQRRMYLNAERRATESHRSFTLTPTTFLDALAKAGGRCEVSGIPFDPTEKRSPFAPSLDRIDCNLGYEPGNIRVVLHIVNVAMNTWGVEPLMQVAEALCGKLRGAGSGS